MGWSREKRGEAGRSGGWRWAPPVSQVQAAGWPSATPNDFCTLAAPWHAFKGAEGFLCATRRVDRAACGSQPSWRSIYQLSNSPSKT